ncbi:MAG: GDYXXLXY domain-containing protein [Pseudomonadota bacterium]
MNQLGDSAARPLSPLFLVAALLPLLGFIGSIALAEIGRWGAPAIQIAIEGFDPRDPIRGRYLLYRVSTNAPRAVDGYPAQACAGTPEAGISPVYLLGPDWSTSKCEHTLPVDFVLDDHRYFVQQDKARELERAVRERRASIVIRLSSERRVAVEELVIEPEAGDESAVN